MTGSPSLPRLSSPDQALQRLWSPEAEGSWNNSPVHWLHHLWYALATSFYSDLSAYNYTSYFVLHALAWHAMPLYCMYGLWMMTSCRHIYYYNYYTVLQNRLPGLCINYNTCIKFLIIYKFSVWANGSSWGLLQSLVIGKELIYTTGNFPATVPDIYVWYVLFERALYTSTIYSKCMCHDMPPCMTSIRKLKLAIQQAM